MKKSSVDKISIQNRRASFDYEMIETMECGIVLTGSEVKSIRRNNANMKGSYVTVRSSEAFIKNLHISPYQQKNQAGYSPTRERKLLLRKNEIIRLVGVSDQDGRTIIPLEIFEKNGVMKLRIGVGKARKKYDKRQYLKKKDDLREIKRALS